MPQFVTSIRSEAKELCILIVKPAAHYEVLG
jgi:hypothetical protein